MTKKLYVSPETFSAIQEHALREDVLGVVETVHFFKRLFEEHIVAGRTEGISSADVAAIGTSLRPEVQVVVGEPPR